MTDGHKIRNSKLTHIFAVPVGSNEPGEPLFCKEEKEEAIFLLPIKSVFCAEEASKNSTARVVGKIAKRARGDKPKDDRAEHHLAGTAKREEN